MFTCKDCLHWDDGKCLLSGYIYIEPESCDGDSEICDEFHFEEDVVIA